MESKRTRDGWDRWACLAAAMVIEACVGLGYTFAVYSQHLKDVLNYDQQRLDAVGAAKDFGYCLGIFGGILYHFIPPWMTIGIGALMHFSGYFMVYMTSARKIVPSFIMISGFIALAVGGDSCIDIASIMTSAQNFGDYRGTAIGVLKAQNGISGAIFVTLYNAFLEPNIDGYVLLIAVVPTLTIIALAVFIRPFPGNDSDSSDDKRFQLAYGATIFLSLYLLFSIFLQAWTDVTRPWLIFFAVTMLMQFFLIIFLLALHRPARLVFDYMIGVTPEKENYKDVELEPRLKLEHSDVGPEIIPEEDDRPLKDGAVDSLKYSHDDDPFHMAGQQRRGYSVLEPLGDNASKDLQVVGALELSEEESEIERYTLWQCCQTFDFWILCLVSLSGPGTGLAVINNFGQIGKSLKSDSAELYVGLISVASCFGRLVGGYGSDMLLRFTTYQRPWCFSLAHIAMGVGCLTLAAGYAPLLYSGSALVGLSYGAYSALIPVIVAEVFGLRNFPALYKLVGAFGPVGAYVLSAKLVGLLYDHEAELQNPLGGEDDLTCVGRKCFELSILILAVICLVGASLGAILSMRTRELYARMKSQSRQ